MNQLQFLRRGTLTSAIAVRVLLGLTLMSFAGLSLAQSNSGDDLQQQRAKMSELKQQLEQQRISMQAMQREMQQRQAEMERQRAEAESQFEEAQHRYQEMQVKAAEAAAKDRQVAVFVLKNTAAPNVADAISNVLSAGFPRQEALRVAVDERGNRLVVSGTAAQVEAVRQLLPNLDVPPSEAAIESSAQAASEMLQVRVIWLADGAAAGEEESAAGKVDGRVLEALRPLGFDSPQVVCQTVTSIVVADGAEEWNRLHRPGHLVGRSFDLRASGKIEAKTDGISCRFVFRSIQPPPVDQTQLANGSCQSAGRDFHAGVELHDPGNGVVVTALRCTAKPKQVPCAFVLQLNRAEDFPAGGGSEPAERLKGT